MARYEADLAVSVVYLPNGIDAINIIAKLRIISCEDIIHIAETASVV